MEWLGIPWWAWVFVIPELAIAVLAIVVASVDAVATRVSQARFHRSELARQYERYAAAGFPTKGTTRASTSGSRGGEPTEVKPAPRTVTGPGADTGRAARVSADSPPSRLPGQAPRASRLRKRTDPRLSRRRKPRGS